MICPRCNKEYTGHPATSRVGLGDICPRCGYEEALEAVGMESEKIKRLVDEMMAAEQKMGNAPV